MYYRQLSFQQLDSTTQPGSPIPRMRVKYRTLGDLLSAAVLQAEVLIKKKVDFSIYVHLTLLV